MAICVIGTGATGTRSPMATLLTNPVLFVPLTLNGNGRASFDPSFPPGLALSARVQAFIMTPARQAASASNGVTLTVTR